MRRETKTTEEGGRGRMRGGKGGVEGIKVVGKRRGGGEVNSVTCVRRGGGGRRSGRCGDRTVLP